MPPQDPVNPATVKEKILLLLRTRGPSLPVHIARETGLNMLFASAFLSELFSENKIKMSYMKIGNSPLYYLSGQESMLENFSHHLKSKEKEAFIILRNKKFLRDSEQEPAIRVALRQIRDFAIPFKESNTQEFIWRYFTVSQAEFKLEPKQAIKAKKISQIKKKEQKERLDIFDKKAKKATKKKPRKRKSVKDNKKFFNKVKDFLSVKSAEITSIESFSKNELLLKIRENNEEEMLIAYNKKRINEADIIKAHKKATESGLKYRIFCLGEPLKRTKELIKALKDLKDIEKINL